MSELAHITTDELIKEISSRMKCMAMICCYDDEDGGNYTTELSGTFHEVGGLLHLLQLEHDYKTQLAYGKSWEADQKDIDGEEWKDG